MDTTVNLDATIRYIEQRLWHFAVCVSEKFNQVKSVSTFILSLIIKRY